TFHVKRYVHCFRSGHSLFCHDFFLTAPGSHLAHTLSLHDALPISVVPRDGHTDDKPWFAYRRGTPMECRSWGRRLGGHDPDKSRSEEHTSELQSRFDLVCRLLLEKKKIIINE